MCTHHWALVLRKELGGQQVTPMALISPELTRARPITPDPEQASPLGIELEGAAHLAGVTARYGGAYISAVHAGGAVHAEGTLLPGDTLVEVDGVTTARLDHFETSP